MCARITQVLDAGEIGHLLQVDTPAPGHPVWNGPPGSYYTLCRTQGTRRVLGRLQWGLRPQWNPDPKFMSINARSETIWRIPSFRQAAERRRAVLPVNGWFEWRAEQGQKQPYHISDADQHVICLAAIWEPPADGTQDETFAVLTTEPREELRGIHHRQPTVLEDSAVGLWLDGATDQEIAALVARQPGRRPLQIRRIDPRANACRYNDPSILQETA